MTAAPILQWPPQRKDPTPRAASLPPHWRIKLLRLNLELLLLPIKWKLEDAWIYFSNELKESWRAAEFKRKLNRELNRYELKKYTSPRDRTMAWIATALVLLIFLLAVMLLFYKCTSIESVPFTRVFILDPVTNELSEIELICN